MSHKWQPQRFVTFNALSRQWSEPDHRLKAVASEMPLEVAYCSGRLIPQVDPGLLTAHPKIVMGSSDITLLLHFMEHRGLVVFHGPIVATSLRQGESAYDRRLLVDILEKGLAARFPTDGCTIR